LNQMVQSTVMYSLFEDKIDRDSDTKDLIFSILADSGKHNLAELTRLIYQHYRLKLTYQAVRKATRKLHLAGIIDVQDGRYFIRRSWLIAVKRRVDALLVHGQRSAANTLPRRPASPEAQGVYHLNSLFDLDNFWGDMVLDYCSGLKATPKPTFYSIAHYAWWMLINLGQETKFWKTVLKQGMPAHMVILSKRPLNLWAIKIYKHIGVKCSVKNIKATDDTILYNIIGDFVVQARLPENAMKRIRLCYQKFKRIEELDSDYIFKIAHEPCQITFSVWRDMALAQNLMRAYGLNSK
jgi:hypothetical protein